MLEAFASAFTTTLASVQSFTLAAARVLALVNPSIASIETEVGQSRSHPCSPPGTAPANSYGLL